MTNMKRKLVATLLGLFVVFSAFAANLNHVMMTSIKTENAVMAQQRHRNVVVWILLSMLASPLIMVIILLCIGDSQADCTKETEWKG